MHEFSIASQIWESVARAARERGGKRVRSVALEIGALNLLEDEQLGFWIRTLAERDGSPDVELKITHPSGRVGCGDCGAEGEPALPEGGMNHLVPLALACATCGSRNVRVVGGRELRVVSAEIEKQNAGGDAG